MAAIVILATLAVMAFFAFMLIVDAVKLWIYGAPPERPVVVNPRSMFLWRVGQGAVFLFLVWAFYKIPDASGAVPKHQGSAPAVVAGAIVVFGTYMITRTQDMIRSLRWRRRR